MGAPIGCAEALSPAKLSRVRVREALVRIQRAQAQDRSAASLDVDPPFPPEVRVDWARSTDRGQRIARFGSSGFEIRGIAGGEVAAASSSRRPSVALGIETTIFGVAPSPGDSADITLDRLVERLDPYYVVEIVARTSDRAAAILKTVKLPPR
jgi:hypothetical protein